MAVVASIPSPSFNSIDIGPLSLNIYGLMIALGVVFAVGLIGRRFEARGIGTSDDASSIAIWAVLAGVIGARLYHVATDWERFANNYSAIPKIWEGGLGIPGGLIVGIPAGLYLAKAKGVPVGAAATCTAVGLPLAQAIGRWGNYFNQELYGRPTDLPWALEIDANHLVQNPETGVDFVLGTTFHPTFLYESLWSLGLMFVLLYIDRRWRPGGGSLMGLYVAGYGLGRFWVEGLRVDPADDIGPLRLNQWVAIAAIAVGLAAYFALRGRGGPTPENPMVRPDQETPDESTAGPDRDDADVDDDDLDDDLDDDDVDDDDLDKAADSDPDADAADDAPDRADDEADEAADDEAEPSS